MTTNLKSAPGATMRMLFLAATAAATLVVGGACSDSTAAPPDLRATSITIFSGNLQSAEVARPTINPLVVEVRDQHNRLMAGVGVQFTTTVNGSIIGNPAVTDTLGQASVGYTFGTVAGEYKITAAADGLAEAPVFTLTARPGPANALRVTAGDAQSGACGTQLPTPLTVKITDVFGNPIVGRTVTWTTNGDGSLTQNTSVTDAQGIATAYLLLGSVPGPYTVFAHSADLADAQFIAIGS